MQVLPWRLGLGILGGRTGQEAEPLGDRLPDHKLQTLSTAINFFMQSSAKQRALGCVIPRPGFLAAFGRGGEFTQPRAYSFAEL